MQRDPKYFENPDKFDPYRFMKDTSNKNAFNYIPFSAGPRNCIGKKKNTCSYTNYNQYYQHIHMHMTYYKYYYAEQLDLEI